MMMALLFQLNFYHGLLMIPSNISMYLYIIRRQQGGLRLISYNDCNGIVDVTA
jgi:hypothetical protein